MSGRAITQVTERAVALRRALTERVVVADGAMGTMLQASDADRSRTSAVTRAATRCST